MKISITLSRYRLPVLALMVMMLVAACGPAPLGTSWAALTTVGDAQNIVMAYNNEVVLVNPVNGKAVELRNADGEIRLDDQGNPRTWKITAENSRAMFFSSPVMTAENTLVLASYDQHLFQVDVPAARPQVPDGVPIEGFSGHLVTDLISDDNLIYAGLSGHDLVALDKTDFSVRWSVATEHGVWAKPLLVDGILYFTSLDHNLYAVDTADGAVLWTFDLEGASVATPVYANGRLYVGSFARKLFEISLDGEKLDEYPTVDWVWSAPSLVDNSLYLADLGGYVYALDIADGAMTEIWKAQVAQDSIRPTPLVVGDTVIVASSDMKVYWLSRENGFTNFSRELTSPIYADLLLIQPSSTLDIPEPLVIVSTMSPTEALVAFTVDQGQRQWVYAIQ
ncbi:MAG: PQQ-binding-like beta-propeller repeat protein [Anaerolineae bacterium]|nr:PQQ-binding-like beta-propeller repeat protein [Anaerolineae bacterium]